MFDREKFHDECVEEIYRAVNYRIEQMPPHFVHAYSRTAFVDGLLHFIVQHMRAVYADVPPEEAYRLIQERAALLRS